MRTAARIVPASWLSVAPPATARRSRRPFFPVTASAHSATSTTSRASSVSAFAHYFSYRSVLIPGDDSGKLVICRVDNSATCGLLMMAHLLTTNVSSPLCCCVHNVLISAPRPVATALSEAILNTALSKLHGDLYIELIAPPVTPSHTCIRLGITSETPRDIPRGLL